MTYPQALATTWLLTLALSVFACQAWAGVTLDAGIGTTIFEHTATDGQWAQQPLPHSWDTHDVSFRIGVSYQWTRWGIHAAMTNFGSIKVRSGFVGDENFDPVRHVCLAMCEKLSWLDATDQVRAYELAGSYRWNPGGISPFVKGGLAMLTHRFTVMNGGAQQLYGRIPAFVIGTGVCYGHGIQACLEADYYNQIKGVHIVGDPASPLFENIVTGLLMIRLPIGG